VTKSIEAMIESQDSQFPQDFQIQDPYSIFQVSQQEEELTDLEKSMECMIQSQKDYIQSQNGSFNRLEAQMSHLINRVNDKNEETLPITFSTIPDWPSHIDRKQESLCLGDFNQDSMSSHHFELDQYQSIDKLASFYFNKIELKHECDPDPQL